VIFFFTTLLNMYEKPEGLKIALWFIATIIGTSLVSRVLRSTEIRIEGVAYDEKAEEFIKDAANAGRAGNTAYPALRIIANRPDTGNRGLDTSRKRDDEQRERGHFDRERGRYPQAALHDRACEPQHREHGRRPGGHFPKRQRR